MVGLVGKALLTRATAFCLRLFLGRDSQGRPACEGTIEVCMIRGSGIAWIVFDVHPTSVGGGHDGRSLSEGTV